MCRYVYIGSRRPLPEIEFKEDAPGLDVRLMGKNDIGYESKARILGTPYLYDVGGWMGCACSIGYDQSLHDLNKAEEAEEFHHAVADVRAFVRYLMENVLSNELKLFVTWWDIFPPEYETRVFDLVHPNEHAFEFPEDVILTLQMDATAIKEKV